VRAQHGSGVIGKAIGQAMSLLQKLGLVASPDSEAPDLVDEIEQYLHDLDPSRAALVAAFAGLLSRVAFADSEISAAELDRIRVLIVTHVGLPAEEAQRVAEIARRRTLAGTEHYRLTRCFNDVASEAERLALIECLYAVAAADDSVAHVEDKEVDQIAAAVLVSRSDVLKIRSRYRDKLEELRALRKLQRETK
jgi:uncharacterized tellurite resistance protein B-like protein